MRDDENAVAGHLEIDLQHLGGVFAHRERECGDGVFRRERGAAAMRDVDSGNKPFQERMQDVSPIGP